MITYIAKINDDRYDLIVVGLTSTFSFNILSTMNKKEYCHMIEIFENLITADVLYFYQFPSLSFSPEIQVRWTKLNTDEFMLSLNLGSVILSETDSETFKQLMYELKDSVSQFIGHKVEFPSAKDIFKNDK